MAKKNKWITNVIIAVVIAIGSWAIFDLAKIGIMGLLAKIGIVAEWKALVVIIVLTIIILLGLGYSFRIALKKLT